MYAAPAPPCARRANGNLSCHVPCLQEALNVLPNTATVKDTAALDEFQRVETERGVRPPPKKGLGEHMNDETNWKKVISALSPCSHALKTAYNSLVARTLLVAVLGAGSKFGAPAQFS